MVRKMAAINFYIRGLNPQNIQQGDSLAKFKPVEDKESKSIVIANPPFGAERDQEAYPEVWEEFSKESETTILFVKLMFEHLKIGGTCATIVSEGFHSWDQFSAKALRKLLLDEAELKAVISLPQGVFVSKNGQGPKTSILLFEKGKPTENVWFFKVTNDGYTMGTNRKQTAGCQLVECLDLYYNYIKQGKQPLISKHSFLIPAKWIKALDPRIKEKIRKETREELTVKGKEQKAKLEEDLKKKLDVSKIDKEELTRQLLQFDEMLESKIENEIASRIEKAHNYSFNLSNYKSNLNEDELRIWKEIFSGINGDINLSLDEIYFHLINDATEEALKYLSSLNPNNTLELDIAREFLFRMTDEQLNNKAKLAELKKVLQREKKYSLEKLENLLIPKYEKIKKADYKGDLEIVEKISFSDGLLHLRAEKETGMDLYKADKGDLVTSKINVHQGAAARATRNLVCSTHYQVYSINKNDVLPEYLIYLLRTNNFLDQLNELKNKGIKNEQGADFYLSQFIPLPSIEEQKEIVEQLDKQKAIIESISQILNNYSIELGNYSISPIGSFANIIGGFSTPSNEIIDSHSDELVPLIKIGNVLNGRIIDGNMSYVRKDIVGKNSPFVLVNGDIIVAMTRPIIKSGLKYAVIDDKYEGSILNQRVGKFTIDNNKMLKEFFTLIIQTKNYLDQLSSFCEDEANQPNISNEEFLSIKVPVPPIDIQEKIINDNYKRRRLFEDLIQLREESKQKFEITLKKVWGEEKE